MKLLVYSDPTENTAELPVAQANGRLRVGESRDASNLTWVIPPEGSELEDISSKPRQT